MARYFAAPVAVGTGQGNSWANAGDLQTMINNVLAAPSPGGDEIWARRGTYSLTSPLSIVGNTAPLSIYGGFLGNEQFLCQRNANIDSLNPNFFQNPSILDGGGTNRVIDIQQANVCRIDGFLIEKGNAGTGNGGGVQAGGRNIWLENLVFMDNMASIGGGIFTIGSYNVMIKNSIFFNNQATGGGGIWIDDGRNTLLVNVLFNRNTVNANGNGAAIYISGGNNMKIINNTIADNTPTNTSVYCMQSPNDVEIYNSILYPDTLVAAGGANVVVDYCCLATNPISILPPPITILNFLPIGTNPLFVNAAGGNYHLSNTATSQSPCIDWGNTNIIFPLSATDLEGYPRIIDKGINTFPPLPITREVDLGAFEVQ